jgi:hypothetical protein
MIEEAYVPFEIAKLLKMKGFPQEYDIYHSMVYNEEDYEDEYEVQRMVLETKLVKAGTLSSYPVGVPEPKCYCCTHQMAMRWLREMHNIHIDICSIWDATHWLYQVFVITPRTARNPYVDKILYTSYEQAIEAGIKYCLKNLI